MNKKLLCASALSLLCLSACSGGASPSPVSSETAGSFSSELSEDIVKHTVRFYVDGELVKSLSVKDGSKMSAPASEELPKGYIVDHWYVLEGSFKSPWSFLGGTVTSDLDLYADFRYETYTVTLLSRNGNGTYESSVTYKQAYDFSGDYQDKADHLENEQGEVFAISGIWTWTHGETLSPILSEQTVNYAFYELLPFPYNQSKLKVWTYSGELEGVSNPNPTSYSGKASNLGAALKPASKEGYRFEGWFSLNQLRTEIKSYSLFYGKELADASDGYYYGTTICGLFSKESDDLDNGILSYGLYPQTYVSDEGIIASLNALTKPSWNSWYFLDGEYYAKKEVASYSSDDGTTIVSETTYWFKCEPIKWKILSSSDEEYSLVSDVILDAHRYDDSSNYYKNSEIREWLNYDFYYSAFRFDDSLIRYTTVDNSASTTDSEDNKYACDNTKDKVYLLSYQDCLNADYGFSTDSSVSDTARCCKITDWAWASGAIPCYWTRSPYSSYSGYAWYVGIDGYLGSHYVGIDGYVDVGDGHSAAGTYGVRPAITIKVA